MCSCTTWLGTVTWESFQQVASKVQPARLKSDTDKDSRELLLKAKPGTRKCTSHFMQKNSWAPSEAEAEAKEHHGKPALLRGTLVSRGRGWRETSLLVDTEAQRIRESLQRVLYQPPTATSLCVAHLPSASTRALPLSVLTSFRKHSQDCWP